MAESQTSDAMGYFGTLSPDEQQEIINYTHTLQSSPDPWEYFGKSKVFI